MRKTFLAALCCAALITTSCGGNSGKPSAAAPLSGNWVFTLNRHASTVPEVFTGFLLQSGTQISGALVLGDGCNGVGAVTGTLSGGNLTLNIDEYGQNLSLTGPTPSNGSMNGQFTTLEGGCTAFPNTGTWTASQVQPLSGNFQGAFTLQGTTTTTNVTGALTQGPNIGASNATLSGGLTTAASSDTCSVIASQALSVNGVISGTSVALNLFAPDGTVLVLIPATATADGKSLTSQPFTLATKSSCPIPVETLSLQLTFQ